MFYWSVRVDCPDIRETLLVETRASLQFPNGNPAHWVRSSTNLDQFQRNESVVQKQLRSPGSLDSLTTTSGIGMPNHIHGIVMIVDIDTSLVETLHATSLPLPIRLSEGQERLKLEAGSERLTCVEGGNMVTVTRLKE